MPQPAPRANERRFRIRAFVSFGIMFSFIASAFAGIVLYFRPEGSLASWTRWQVLGIDKKGWEGVHTVAVVLFLLFAAIHMSFNRKTLWAYLRKRAAGGFRSAVECAAALFVVTLILAATVCRWQPIWKIVDLRSEIKQGRFTTEVQPPSANAEELSLVDLSGLARVSAETALERLRTAGFPAEDPSVTLGGLAAKYHVSPEKLYRIIAGK
jgi:hypothetical protein